MFDVSREDIVEGRLGYVLVVMAGPLVIQNFALVAQEVVDLFWVGRLGSTAVAGVGLAVVVVGLALVPFMMLVTGTQVVTSQRVGADAEHAARQVPYTAAAMALGLACVIGASVLLGAEPFVSLLTDDPQVAADAVSYLTAYVAAFFTIGASDTLEGGFTGWGDTRAALYINGVAIAVNLLLDPLLILGLGPFPRWEVFGAGIATAIGYGVGALFAVALALRGRMGFRLTTDILRPTVETARDIVRVGAPIAGQNAGRQIARLGMVGLASLAGGAAGLAAYHLGSRVATIAFVPARGLGQAATSVVGQNLGAERPERARAATWLAVLLSVVGLTGIAAVQWAVPGSIAHAFVPDLSGQTLEYSVSYLQILALGYWALGVIYTVEAGFNGAGNTTISMYSTLAQYWLVRLPIAVLGVYVLDIGVDAVFWGVTLSNVAAAIWLAVYFGYATRNDMLERAVREVAGSTPGD